MGTVAKAFGASVDVSKSRIIVGANKDENEAKKAWLGFCLYFSNSWRCHVTQEAKLTADEPQEGAGFGFSVATRYKSCACRRAVLWIRSVAMTQVLLMHF